MIFNVRNLDIVITRNCQLNCTGCLTFSDHNKVKGHTDLNTAMPWLEFWASKLNPQTLHIFGGEPLMNSEFPNWVKSVSALFSKQTINVQTNGIKITQFDHDTLFDLIHNYNLQLSISKHNQLPWYEELINKSVSLLETIVGVGAWTEINATERVYVSNNKNHSFRIVDHSTNDISRNWANHYNGYGRTLKPGLEFDSPKYVEHHGFCEAKEYIQLYEGSLYKCPTMAVLDNTLASYDYPNKDAWEPWLNYQKLPMGASDDNIQQWLATQAGPEKYCNMCFIGHPEKIVHTLKVKEIDQQPNSN